MKLIGVALILSVYSIFSAGVTGDDHIRKSVSYYTLAVSALCLISISFELIGKVLGAPFGGLTAYSAVPAVIISAYEGVRLTEHVYRKECATLRGAARIAVLLLFPTICTLIFLLCINPQK